MNLKPYQNRQIKITDIDGDIFIGKATGYISAENNPDGFESISIKPKDMPDWDGGYLICFTEHDISAIEIIE
ncbi:MAG: hypothetical protein FWG64_03295 [Firmicutes bacterium]|nr:hypothetical protein [Bacillota bacterium]